MWTEKRTKWKVSLWSINKSQFPYMKTKFLPAFSLSLSLSPPSPEPTKTPKYTLLSYLSGSSGSLEKTMVISRGGGGEMVHKVPSGEGAYARAKHAQQVAKDQEGAIELFRKAIREGDRVDSALKDMAVLLSQLDRTHDAIQAIISFRCLCSKYAQQSLDNLLFDLYKKCGRVDEQIDILKQKLRMIYQGEAFNGKPTKTARSHGKKFQVSIQHELSRILGNLGWAYMQKTNYMAAEVVYRKAQMIDPDANKACNLGLCLIHQGRYKEARSVLEDVRQAVVPGSEDIRAKNRAEELLMKLELRQPTLLLNNLSLELEDEFLQELDTKWGSLRSRRLPIFEQISNFRDQLAC